MPDAPSALAIIPYRGRTPGLPMNQSAYSREVADSILAMIESGITAQESAVRHGLPKDTLTDWVKKDFDGFRARYQHSLNDIYPIAVQQRHLAKIREQQGLFRDRYLIALAESWDANPELPLEEHKRTARLAAIEHREIYQIDLRLLEQETKWLEFDLERRFSRVYGARQKVEAEVKMTLADLVMGSQKETKVVDAEIVEG